MHLKVNLYSTPSCGYCTAAKRYFKQLGIPFREYDVSKDRKAADKMVRKTGQMGVPVIEIGNKIVVGFDKNKINNYLGI